MNNQTRLNTLRNLEKFRTDVDKIRAIAMTCDAQILKNTIIAARAAFKAATPQETVFTRFFKCAITKKWVEKKDNSTYIENVGLVSNAARDQTCKKCRHCGKWFLKEWINEHDMCDTCAANHFFCTQCESVHPISDRREAPDGMTMCKRCFERLYTRCSECDIVIPRSEARSHDGDEYCSVCYEDSGYDAGDYIHGYGHKPNYPSYGSQRRFGLEIELEGGSRAAKPMCKGLPEIYCKRDGSLSDGFEVVTHPLVFDEAVRVGARIGEIARDNDMRGDNGTCGIHVHVSRGGIKKQAETVSKMLILFSRFKENIEKFARRGESRWAKVSVKTKADYDRDADKFLDVERSDRYRAINLQNSRTVEFRIFKGTNNPKTIMAIVQFVNAFVDYCEVLDFNLVENIQWADIFRPKVGDPKYSEMFHFMKDTRRSLWSADDERTPDVVVAVQAAPKKKRKAKIVEVEPAMAAYIPSAVDGI